LGSTLQLPDASTVAELLSSTLGDKIEAKEEGARPPDAGEVTATYMDADGELKGALLLTTALAACLGAALVKLPPAAAMEAVAHGTFSDTLVDDLHEVLNIAAQLFRASGGRRIVLANVYLAAEPVPDEVAARLKQPAAALSLEIKIPRYTTGKMCLVSIASGG
jgi:hypothetical protein